MKKNFFAMLLTILLTPISVNAATLLVNSNGKLTGATDVIVNGDLFNVSFVDGSCADVFNGCNDSTDFFFKTRNDAFFAGQALLDQVFVDVTAGNFDSDVTSTFGCEQNTSVVCVGLVTYQEGLFGTSTDTLTDVVMFTRNFEAGSSSDNVGATTYQNAGGLIALDTSINAGINFNGDQTVWAVFSAPTTVPVPASIWLFFSGLISLIGISRSSKSSALSA